MSNTRYIEIDSTYRDRTRWPLASEFEIPISQTGIKGRKDALDPVSEAQPVKTWTSNNFNVLTATPSVTVTVEPGTALTPIGYVNSNSVFIVNAPIGELQKIEGYYDGLMANNTTIGEKVRLLYYEYIGVDSTGTLDRAALVMSGPYGPTFNSGDTIVFEDPTDFTNPSEPLVFIPYGSDGENAYISYILYNESLNEWRKIIRYFAATKIALLDTTVPTTGWLSTHNYSLRSIAPCLYGNIVSATILSITLPATASVKNNFYRKLHIRMTSGATKNETTLITTYDGATKVATINKPLSSIPLAGDSFEILPFSYDNATPFVYSGSMVSQQEEVCYEIELMNLILPNKTIDTAFGSRIAYYPYLYVEFVNVSGSSAGVKNIIYSNNPNSVRMLFRAAVDDVSNPLTTRFVKIDGDGMVQTIKFKPNDTLKFSVRFPNGELYKTILEEYYSPSTPNPEAQISACFALKRL